MLIVSNSNPKRVLSKEELAVLLMLAKRDNVYLDTILSMSRNRKFAESLLDSMESDCLVISFEKGKTHRKKGYYMTLYGKALMDNYPNVIPREEIGIGLMLK